MKRNQSKNNRKMNTLPIYELKISSNVDDDSEVNFVALVDKPAIEKNFMAFQFVEPSKGERKDDFLPRCISYVMNEGKDNEQAVAICNSMWEQHFAETSYSDYPKAAKENAQTALNWAEKNGWGDCGTQVGKARANQLAKGEPISRDTIARMASFERHRQNSQKELGDGCGRLMWLAWGGDEGIAWAQRKLEQIDKFAKAKISFDYDDTLLTAKRKELAKKAIANGEDVYIISARDSKDAMLATANDLGISESKVYATGSNEAKIAKIKELGISKHYDNNADVIKQLGSIGEKFMQQYFAVTNEDKRIVSGPLMIAEKPIYRNDEFGEYYIKFTADTIKEIAIKYAKKGFQNNVNLMHDDGQIVNGLTMFESFICDKSRGIMPMQGFEDVSDGSWFGSFYVENDNVWNDIKAGKFKGFSVEGLFKYKPLEEEMTAEMLADEINNILSCTDGDY